MDRDRVRTREEWANWIRAIIDLWPDRNLLADADCILSAIDSARREERERIHKGVSVTLGKLLDTLNDVTMTDKKAFRVTELVNESLDLLSTPPATGQECKHEVDIDDTSEGRYCTLCHHDFFPKKPKPSPSQAGCEHEWKLAGSSLHGGAIHVCKLCGVSNP